jgi:hypothetical protein
MGRFWSKVVVVVALQRGLFFGQEEHERNLRVCRLFLVSSQGSGNICTIILTALATHTFVVTLRNGFLIKTKSDQKTRMCKRLFECET